MRRFLARLSQRKTLVNVGALFSGASAARVLSALSIFVLARQIGVEAFGLYTAVLSLAKLTAVFFSLGLDSWLLRNGRRRSDRFASIIGANVVMKVSFGVVWLLLLVMVAPLLNQEVFPLGLMLIGGLAVWFEELANSAWSAFKVAWRNKTTVWLMVSTQVILLGLTIGLAFVGVEGAVPYMAVRMLAFVVAAGIGLWFAFRAFGIDLRHFNVHEVGQETLPFGLSHGLATIYERADITIIAYALGKAAAGLYAPAISLMTTLFLIPLAIYEVMLPILGEAHAQGRAVKKLAFRLIVASAAIGVVLGLGLVVIAHPLVWLVYGQEFAFSGTVLTVLSGVLVFKCASFGVATVVAAVGWQGRRVWVQLVTAVFNVSVNLYFVRDYGIMGVAYIYVLTEFLLLAGYLFVLLRWQQQPQQMAHLPS